MHPCTGQWAHTYLGIKVRGVQQHLESTLSSSVLHSMHAGLMLRQGRLHGSSSRCTGTGTSVAAATALHILIMSQDGVLWSIGEGCGVGRAPWDHSAAAAGTLVIVSPTAIQAAGPAGLI